MNDVVNVLMTILNFLALECVSYPLHFNKRAVVPSVSLPTGQVGGARSLCRPDLSSGPDLVHRADVRADPTMQWVADLAHGMGRARAQYGYMVGGLI